jgi:hypothetical protein
VRRARARGFPVRMRGVARTSKAWRRGRRTRRSTTTRVPRSITSLSPFDWREGERSSLSHYLTPKGPPPNVPTWTHDREVRQLLDMDMNMNERIRRGPRRVHFTFSSEGEAQEVESVDPVDLGAGPRTTAPISDPNAVMNLWLRQTCGRMRTQSQTVEGNL